MPDPIAIARTEYVQAKAALVHALATTPDSRVGWSPSIISRTPLQIAAHAANSVGNILRTLQGDADDGRSRPLVPRVGDRPRHARTGYRRH